MDFGTGARGCHAGAAPLVCDRTLHVLSTGELRTDAGSSLTLAIAGGLSVDAGGKITGNAAATGSSSGAATTITAAGAVLLAGNGTRGAVISADQPAGSCAIGQGGRVTLRSTFASPSEAIVVQSGARVSADGRCIGGGIDIAATQGGVEIQGTVQSTSTVTGTGAKEYRAAVRSRSPRRAI